MPVPSFRFSLFKRRSSGVWYIGYYDEAGRRKWMSTGAMHKHDALRALSEFRELFKRRVPSVSLSQYFSQFLTYAESTYSARDLTFPLEIDLR